MRREAILASAATAVLGALLVAATLVPATVATPAQDRVRPSELDIRETSIAAGEVTGETATLRLTTRFAHGAAPPRTAPCCTVPATRTPDWSLLDGSNDSGT